jgi:hypothetical protein
MAFDLVHDLRRQISTKQIVCVVGAGVSYGSCAPDGRDHALWTGLVGSGVEWAHKIHPMLPAGWADDKLKALGSEDLDDLLAVASQVASKLGAPTGGEYAEWLHRTVGALTVDDPSLIEAIGALDVPIVTTNYDHLLEDVLGRAAVSWRNEPEVDRILRGDSNAILHLHGHYTEPESVVLGLWEYADIAHHEHTQAVMRALGLAKSLLFVGFGAGLRDPNFKRFLRWLRRVSHAAPYRHYRLGRTREAQDLRREHDADERIVVIAYGEGFADLPPFLRSLTAVPELIVDDPYTRRMLTPVPMDAPPSPLPEETSAPYDELSHLEHDLDQRMVGEFTLLEILDKGAAAHADWAKRSARTLMSALQKRAADLCNREELEDVYWWLHVYGVLKFQGIGRWWGRRRDWEHSVDFAEIAERGRHLLNRRAARAQSTD